MTHDNRPSPIQPRYTSGIVILLALSLIPTGDSFALPVLIAVHGMLFLIAGIAWGSRLREPVA